MSLFDPDLEERTFAARTAMQMACTLLDLPWRSLQVLQRPRRDIGFNNQSAVFYYAPRLVSEPQRQKGWGDAVSLVREGAILKSVGRHFTDSPWQIPQLLASEKAPQGIVHAHSFLQGTPLTQDKTLATLAAPQRDAVCRQVGRMLGHLHGLPLSPVMENISGTIEPGQVGLQRSFEWLSHGRLANGEVVDASLCQSFAKVLQDGQGYLDTSERCFVHGDFYGGNILRDGPKLSLVDFECAGVADYHTDFISLHPFTLPQKKTIADAYEAVSGRKVDLGKVAYLNCLKAADYFASHAQHHTPDITAPTINEGLKSALSTWEETRALKAIVSQPRVARPVVV